MNHNKHWEQTYSSNQTEALGWYTPHLQTSLSWIRELGLDANAPIIDVGGGASTLVDDLLEAGQRSITVLDISDKALSLARARLGEKAKLVKWLEGNITSVSLPHRARTTGEIPRAAVKRPETGWTPDYRYIYNRGTA